MAPLLALAISPDAVAPLALVFTVSMIVLYFVPTIAARKKKDRDAILAINFFLGWTVIGWVVALAWALKSEEPRTIVIRNDAPALAGVTGPAMLCAHCGKYNLPESIFCTSCGGRFVTA